MTPQQSTGAFPVPAGWTASSSGTVSTLTGPEGDVRVSFVELDSAATVPETALAAWRLIDPEFASAVAREVALPPQSGWDEAYQILYQVPAREARMELAFVRKLSGRAFVNLVTGTTAAISRRGAQINEVILGWKPLGLKEISLKDAVAAPWTEEQSQALKQFVLAGMSAMRVPGVSIAIVQGGRIVYQEGLGVRDIRENSPVTPKTRFMIGSATKPLTTLLMAKLVDEKRVSWSTKVVELLPDFSLADRGVTQRLELRHTASASTGMPRRDAEFVFKYSGITAEDRLAEMKGMSPTTGFGETFQYSNFLVAAGGYAAARAFDSSSALEQAYDTALAELVLKPLAMRNSFLRQEIAMQGEAAFPHATDFDGTTRRIPLKLEMAVHSVAPAGALWSTTGDLARYLLLELGKGQMPDGTRIVSEEALLERRQKGVRIDQRSSYGLGLFVGEESGIQVITHGGNTFGFTADLYFLPEKDFGAVVLTNVYAANGFVAAIRQKIFQIVFGAEPKAEQSVASWVKLRDDGVALLQQKVATNPDKLAWMEPLVGTYRSDELGSATLSRREDGYWMEFDEWGTRVGGEIEAGGDRLLRLLDPPWRGTLKLLAATDNGSLILDQAQNKYIFRRAG